MKKKPAGKRGPAENKPAAIVGIAVSAGGIEALTQLLSALPADTGLSFVLSQCSRQEFPAGVTKMPVVQVADSMPVERNHIYVLPSGAEMVLREDMLHLAGPDAGRQPFEHFFSSLAKAATPPAIGVILSGTGSDGTADISAIRKAGGITFAQDPEPAHGAGEPVAIASGQVDLVLTPERIAAELARLAASPFIEMLQADTVPHLRVSDAEWSRLFGLLPARGIDFSLYQQSFMKRRLARRMAVCGARDVAAYVEILEINSGERASLFEEFLIRQTGFFRDPDVFIILRTSVLAGFLAEKSEGDALRIWVPGCSTGEEAYSLAITLLESVGDRPPPVRIQIFGTDLSEKSLERARTGIYAAADVTEVPQAQLSRYFVETNGSYQVIPQVREMCLFARHDLTHDPPFLKLDVIVCRDVLRFVEPAVQSRILARFHWGLQWDGVLVIDRTENLYPHADLFTAADPENRIFRKAVGAHVSAGIAPAEQRESLARALLDASPQAVLAVGKGGRIILASATAEIMFGYPQKGLLGQELESLIPERLQARHPHYRANWFADHRRGRVGTALELTGVRTDGSELPVEVNLSSVETGGGTVGAVFITDITERSRNRSVTAYQARRSAEVAALGRLRKTAERLWQSQTLREGLERMIEAGGMLLGADFGIIQLLNMDKGVLEIAAHRGFAPVFLERYREVSAADGTACGRSLRNKQSVFIEDVTTDPEFEPHRAAAARAGFRSVLSTPLIGSDARPLGVFSAHFRQPHRPTGEELARLDLYANEAAQFIERMRTEQQLQGLSGRLLEMQETGNREVARELHDVFSQELAAVCIQLSLVSGRLKDNTETAQRITEITERIGRLSRDIHQTSRELHPSILEDLGLEPALRQECDSFQQRTLIRTEFYAGTLPAMIPHEAALCLYRVAQEGLRNVHEHSTSSAVLVRIEGAPGGITLRIEDSGTGFDLAAAMRRGGLGLVSMEERVRLVKGKLTVESEPGKGTTLTVFVPLPAGEEKNEAPATAR